MSIIVLSSKIFFAVSQDDEDIIAVKISDILHVLKPQRPKLVPRRWRVIMRPPLPNRIPRAARFLLDDRGICDLSCGPGGTCRAVGRGTGARSSSATSKMLLRYIVILIGHMMPPLGAANPQRGAL